MNRILKFLYNRCVYLFKFTLFKRRVTNKFPGSFVLPRNIFNLDKVEIGEFTYGELNINMWRNPAYLKIGRYVSIAPRTTFILGGNHPTNMLSTYPFYSYVLRDVEKEIELTKGPIIVEDDVWIGTNCLVLSGVKIGQGAIIAAGSVIVKDVPPYAIVGGNPAKIIKYRFKEQTISTLIKKVNFAKLTREKIVENIDILTEPLDDKNLDRYISLFES